MKVIPKSNKFQRSEKYKTPSAVILMIDSTKKIAENATLKLLTTLSEDLL